MQKLLKSETSCRESFLTEDVFVKKFLQYKMIAEPVSEDFFSHPGRFGLLFIDDRKIICIQVRETMKIVVFVDEQRF